MPTSGDYIGEMHAPDNFSAIGVHLRFVGRFLDFLIIEGTSKPTGGWGQIGVMLRYLKATDTPPQCTKTEFT